MDELHCCTSVVPLLCHVPSFPSIPIPFCPSHASWTWCEALLHFSLQQFLPGNLSKTVSCCSLSISLLDKLLLCQLVKLTLGQWQHGVQVEDIAILEWWVSILPLSHQWVRWLQWCRGCWHGSLREWSHPLMFVTVASDMTVTLTPVSIVNLWSMNCPLHSQYLCTY